MNAVTSASLDIRLQDLLRQMRLPTVSANYRKLASEAADSGQPYEEYLLALLEQEAAQRDINRRKRRIREARFPILHTLDEYDFSLMPRLSKPKILELARGNFLDKAENAVFVGAIGTGKTHLATAVGLAACEQGRRVRFYTTAGLINDLLEAAEVHQLSRLERQLMKHDLVILDELGFVPFSQQGAQMLFSFISQRYLRGSILVTTNLAFADWTEVFQDARLVGALLDRLTHHCHVVEFEGDSFRFRQSLARQSDADAVSEK
jgi:DNA replication protein DnaC